MGSKNITIKDVLKWRENFPILKNKTYLLSHSMGAVPIQTQQSLQNYYKIWAEKGPDAWEEEWWDTLMQFSRNIEKIINAPKHSVILMQNATRAMAAVASSLNYTKNKNKIILTDIEFTTFYPLWLSQKKLGAEIVIVKSENNCSVNIEKLLEAIDDRTLLVATCHAYFVSGAMLDVKTLTKHAHSKGAKVLIDGYQVVGRVPVNVIDDGVDFYVGGSHKWLCGGAGAGFLYVKKELIPELKPTITGWFGLADPFSYEIDTQTGGKLADNVRKFWDGTPNAPAAFAAIEGTKWILNIGVENIYNYAQELTQQIIEWALNKGLKVNSPVEPNKRNGMVCIEVPEPQKIVEVLKHHNIIIDWRPLCGLRISAHFYNNEEDIYNLFNTLNNII